MHVTLRATWLQFYPILRVQVVCRQLGRHTVHVSTLFVDLGGDGAGGGGDGVVTKTETYKTSEKSNMFKLKTSPLISKKAIMFFDNKGRMSPTIPIPWRHLGAEI